MSKGLGGVLYTQLGSSRSAFVMFLSDCSLNEPDQYSTPARFSTTIPVRHLPSKCIDTEVWKTNCDWATCPHLHM